VTPPADDLAWAELVRRLARHWVERYGPDEVRRRSFEVWNEPNLPAFWAGTREQYFELYRHTALALKEVDAQLRVGGPATAANAWVEEFLAFCAGAGLPAVFVSTHHYPNDPLWSEQQDTESQLAGGTRGILRQWGRQVKAQARGRPVYFTEWNVSSNPRYPRQDEPYAAAFVVKSVLEMAGLAECYSFWTFTDIFEENYFPSLPFHGGFGLLTLHGIPKPNYRAFELLHRLGEEQLPVEGTHRTADAWAVRQGNSLTVLLTNHAMPRQPIEAERVRIELSEAPAPRAVWVERIDEGHANPKAAWLVAGAREYLGDKEVERLEEASRLVREPHPWQVEGGTVRLEIDLPAHSVAALTVV